MRLIAVFLVASFCSACGGESTSSAHKSKPNGAQDVDADAPRDTGGAAGAAGTAGTGSFVPDQGCKDDSGCQLDSACLHYTPDGPSECVPRHAPTTSCQNSSGLDECCTSEDCNGATCFAQVVGVGPQCGLGGFTTLNRCMLDSCHADDDCAEGELCVPNGFGTVRECMAAGCRSDADCTAAAGGACIVFGDRCCTNSARSYRPKQLACVYANDGCKEDTDCPSMQYCVLEGGRGHCSSTCL